jgi:hypothetical protein
MNLAGDYNEYYPFFNPLTKEEDEFACGQPSLLFRADVKATEGNQYTPVACLMSLWEDGINTLAPIDESITTATDVFDTITVQIIRPKPIIIDKNKVEEMELY